MAWLTFQLFAVHASRFATNDRPAFRQHYGVYFKPRVSVLPITGHWMHSFGLRLPTRPTFVRETESLNCTDYHVSNRTHCERVKPFLDQVRIIQTSMMHILHEVILSIETLVPHSRSPRSGTRHTRSWLPFLGNILKTVTGTATDADVRKISATVDELRATQSHS